MNKLKKYGRIVGYSGHERGVAITLASIGFGARIIERHLTLDKNMERTGSCNSLEKDEFRQLIKVLEKLSQRLVHAR